MAKTKKQNKTKSEASPSRQGTFPNLSALSTALMDPQQIPNSPWRTTSMIEWVRSSLRRQSYLSAISNKLGKKIVSSIASLALTKITNLPPAATRPNLTPPQQPDDLELGLQSASGSSTVNPDPSAGNICRIAAQDDEPDLDERPEDIVT